MAEQQARPEPGADVGILVTIRSLLPNLAPVERRVAQAVLDDPQGVAWRSISELARACGTSATSVVRFCRAVGLRGYPDLRLALAGAVARDDAAAFAAASHDIGPDDDAAAITKKIAYADARAVTDTASHLDIAILVQVTEALAKAGRIDIYGVGASGFVALDLQMKLQRIGRPARPSTTPSPTCRARSTTWCSPTTSAGCPTPTTTSWPSRPTSCPVPDPAGPAGPGRGSGVPLTGRGTPLLCGRCPRGKRRTAHLPMAPFCLNDDLTV